MERKKLSLKKKESLKDQDTALKQQDKKENELKDDIQEWVSEGGSLGPPPLDEDEK